MMLKKLLLIIVLLPVCAYAQNQTAIFAGGCFWCVQADFDKLPGVVKTYAGYDGGKRANPTYRNVAAGGTRYAESVKVIYNPNKVSYPQLLNYFWHHIDPTVKDAQFCDHGPQYRTAIFYLNPTQQRLAMQSLQAVQQQLNTTIYTQIVPSTRFYSAETYHQDYYKKHPLKYQYYRWSCGRDARVKEIWGS